MKLNTWKELTVSQFNTIWQYFKDETVDDIDKQVKLLSMCLDKSEDYVLDLPLYKIKELSKKYSFIGGLPTEGKAKSFWAGGYKWKANKNISKLSASDYITLSEYTKSPDVIISKLPEILNIFCEPRFYLKKPDTAKRLKSLAKTSIWDAYSLALFFCRLSITLTADMGPYLEKTMKENLKNLKSKTD